MNTICQDVFDNIGKYLLITDVIKLKRTNRLLRIFANEFQKIYLTRQLKISNKSINIIQSKQYFYEYIKYTIYIFCINNRFLINYGRNDVNGGNDVNDKNRRNDLVNLNIKHYFKNKYLNDIILDVFYYYINTDCLTNYSNIFNLVLITCFIYIEYYKENISLDNGFNFFKLFNNKNTYVSNFQDIMINYYIYILDSIHSNRYVYNTFEKIYDISPYVINIFCLKKIFSYRVLNLSKTKILFCCNLESCIVNNLNDICDTKYVYNNDDLISHNYLEIKSFLYNQSIEYYNILIDRENYLINKKIYFINPATNKRISVNGKKWIKLICSLKKNNKKMYNDIITNILQQQNDLRNKIFGKFFN